MTKFKVGDKVRHVLQGKGKVIRVDECDCFQPYFVAFRDCNRWSTENNLILRESKWTPVSKLPTEDCIVRVKLSDGTRAVAHFVVHHYASQTGVWFIYRGKGGMYFTICDQKTVFPYVVSWKPIKTKKEQA